MSTQSAAVEPARAEANQHIGQIVDEPLDEPAIEPEPIRLLKVLTNFFPGGTERQALNLVRGIDRDKFDLHFSCLERVGDYLESFEALDMPIREFRVKRLYHPQCFMQQVRFAAHLREQHIQIMHSYNFYANVFAVPAARLAGVPVVLASVRDRGVYLSAAQRKLQRWVLGLADRVLVNADSIRDWLLEQGLNGERISVIKNGINLSRYRHARESSDVRRGLGISESAPIVTLIARLNPTKGIDDLIKAAAILAPRWPAARFLVVGEGLQSKDGVSPEGELYRATLQQLAQSLGVAEQVIFTGHREDTPELLSESAISVLPSHSEGLSNTVLESMAAGVPTVATNVGGNPELIQEGVNGRLVPVKSPERLAQAIESLLANPQECAKLGAQARDMAWNNYSMSGMVTRTQDLYREQLRQAKRVAA